MHHDVVAALVEVPAPLAGASAVSGGFWHFRRTPAVVGGTPVVGEHNEAALTGLPGYSEAGAQPIATMALNGQAAASGTEAEAPLKYRGNEMAIVGCVTKLRVWR